MLSIGIGKYKAWYLKADIDGLIFYFIYSYLFTLFADMDEDPMIEEMRSVINHKEKSRRAYEDDGDDENTSLPSSVEKGQETVL